MRSVRPEGDFDQIIKQYQRMIHSRILSNKCPESYYWDAYQEALLALHEARYTYDPNQAKFTTWAWAAIDFALKNFLKKHVWKTKKFKIFSIEQLLPNSREIALASPPLQKSTYLVEEMKALIESVLSVEEKEILEARLDSFTLREIGEMRKITTEAVRQKIKKIFSKMRPILKNRVKE